MADAADHPGPQPGTDEEFKRAVEHELAALGFTVTRWSADGLDCVKADDPDEKRSLGLSNVYRRCRNSDRADWPAVIRDFLDAMVLTVGGAAKVPDDLAEAADRLLVRVGRPFADPKASPWSKRLPGTELVINLVIDSEKFMTYVTPDAMRKSDRPPGEWLDLGLENLRRSTPEGWLSVLHEESGILCGHCNDSYDAARALVLPELRDPGPGGWLLCIPARDWLFCLPVSVDHLQHFHLLKVLAEKNYEKEPYPISDEVYWVRGRKWEVFKIELTEEGVKVYPSQEFAEALGMYAKDGGEGGEPAGEG